MGNRIKNYIDLMRLNRPIGIWLVMWSMLWALWLASHGHPKEVVFWIFIAGVVLVRSAGCVINDFADRTFDKHVERTNKRPLTAGKILPIEAIVIFVLLATLAFLLVLKLNALTIILAVIAIALTVIYPFMKRFTYWPQAVLGLAFSMSIPMAFAAQTGGFAWVIIPLMLINFCWTVAYDTLYAMCDRQADLGIGIKSTAILFAEYDRLVVLVLQIAALLGWVFVSYWLALSYYVDIAVVVSACFVIYQQALIKERDPQKYFQAFLNNNWFGLTIFVGLFFNYLFKH